MTSAFASFWSTDVWHVTLALALGLPFALWLLSIKLRDASIVDPFWGPGFVLLTSAAFVVGDGYAPRRTLLLVLVAIWGLRLGAHLLSRNARKGEDFRYAAMREYWGASFWWVSLFSVFLLQGVLMWFISLPLQYVQTAAGPSRWTWLDALGVLLFAAGLFFESVGDQQLRRFKADPANRGRVLDTGLWAYTRHPNYFGDAVVWWGFFAIAAAAPGGALTVLSPALMTFFLMKVSGVALLERSLVKTRPGYADYVQRTSSFFPLPPKRDSAEKAK